MRYHVAILGIALLVVGVIAIPRWLDPPANREEPMLPADPVTPKRRFVPPP